MAAGYRTDDVRGLRPTRTRAGLTRDDDGGTEPLVPGAPAGTAHGDRPDAAEAAGAADAAARVAESLDGLRHRGWTVLHGLHWPGRAGDTVDHVVVGRGGVVVVHVRSWTGTVTVADGWLRQNGFRRDRELDRAYAGTAAVAGVLRPEHRHATIGLVCLARHDQALEPTSAGVPVVGRDHLLDVLLSTPPRLRVDEVADIAGVLARRLTRDLIPGQATASSARPSSRRGAWPSTATPWRR